MTRAPHNTTILCFAADTLNLDLFSPNTPPLQVGKNYAIIKPSKALLKNNPTKEIK